MEDETPNTQREPIDFNFNFLELLEERNLDQLLKDIKEEMFADCTDIEIILSETKNQAILFEYLINYVGKYCFFIYHFEYNTKYEHCAEIKRFFFAMAKTYFTVTNELLEAMMLNSIETYRNLDK